MSHPDNGVHKSYVLRSRKASAIASTWNPGLSLQLTVVIGIWIYGQGNAEKMARLCTEMD